MSRALEVGLGNDHRDRVQPILCSLRLPQGRAQVVLPGLSVSLKGTLTMVAKILWLGTLASCPGVGVVTTVVFAGTMALGWEVVRDGL